MRQILLPLGFIFDGLTRVRKQLYKNGIVKSQKLAAPTVSVGNLTVGGTGKTPLVDYLLTQCEQAGIKTCVLTRGYGRETKDIVLINKKTLPSIGGDEPVWLAQRHPLSLIAVGADRTRVAKVAQRTFRPDFFILDDGFQHLKIERDLDIVLVDATRPFWHYNPLPAGYARDPLSSLNSKHMVVLTRVNQAPAGFVEQLEEKIKSCGVTEIFHCRTEVKCVEDLVSGKNVEIRNKKVYLVSGIANPESFESLVKEWGPEKIVFHDMKSDHFEYTRENFLKLLREATDRGADCVVTTEKDGIKLRNFIEDKSNIPVLLLKTFLSFNPKLPEIYELARKRRH